MKTISKMFLSTLLVFANAALAGGYESDRDVVEACAIARSAFVTRIKEKSGEKWEFSEYMSDIKNYSMGVAETSDRYVVVFQIKRRDFIGGRWFYEIDKKTMKISRSYGFK